MIGMQKGRRPDGDRIEIGSYVFHENLPDTLFRVKQIHQRAYVNLVFFGGSKPTAEEHRDYLKRDGTRIPTAWIGKLHTANAMQVLALSGSEE